MNTENEKRYIFAEFLPNRGMTCYLNIEGESIEWTQSIAEATRLTGDEVDFYEHHRGVKARVDDAPEFKA